MKTLLSALAAGLSIGVTACDSGTTGVDLPAGPRILVEATGGLAGADLAWSLTEDGQVLGVRCRSACDFEEGDTLHTLSALQAEALEYAMYDAGVADVRGLRDYGVPCCDQLEYTLTFADGDREGVVRGTGESLPQEFTRLVHLLQGFRQAIAPVLVLGEPRVEGYPQDPVEIVAATLDPPYLDVRTRFGGGCARHDLDLVWLGAWSKSLPAQIDVDLSHEDHDDACDALLTVVRRFDLTPLREAYETSYGPGSGSIAIRLGPASGGPRSIVAWHW